MAVKVGVQAQEDTFRGLCQCGYSTSGWPTEEIAAARIRQHKKEEEGGVNEDGTAKYPMQLLSEFRDSYMLVANGNSAVFTSDVKMLDDEPGDTE